MAEKAKTEGFWGGASAQVASDDGGDPGAIPEIEQLIRFYKEKYYG